MNLMYSINVIVQMLIICIGITKSNNEEVFNITSNQLARESNRIAEERVRVEEEHNAITSKYNDETVAINQQIADETGRHNKVIEEVQKESNRLQENYNTWKREYEGNSLRIQEAYNTAYLAWQKEFGEAKLELERELKDLEKEKFDLDRWWREDVEGPYKAGMLTLETKLKTSQAKYNEVMAGLAYYEADTKRFQAEVGAYAARSKALVDRYNAITNRLNVNNSYEIDLMGVQTKQRQNEISYMNALNQMNSVTVQIAELEQHRLEWQQTSSQRTANVFATYARPITDALTAIAKGITSALGYKLFR